MPTPTSASPSTTRTADAEKRLRVIERLEGAFLADGFSSTTIDELCRKLRMSKSTLYLVGDSREQIIEAVVRHFFAQATVGIEAAVAAQRDPRTRIVTYLTGVGTEMSRNSPAFYTDMVSYPPTERIYRINSDAAAARVRVLIDEGVTAGVFTSRHADFAAHAVALLVDGVHSGRLLEATGLSAGEAFIELGELIINGLVVRDQSSP